MLRQIDTTAKILETAAIKEISQTIQDLMNVAGDIKEMAKNI